MVRQAMKKNFRCLVLSDTHGDMHVLREAIEKEKPFDTLVHCGDVEGSLGSVLGVQTFGYLAVRGNCDLVSDVPRELLFNLGGSRIFVTHGHRFQVRYDVQPLIRQGHMQNADVVLYGHTHVPALYRDETTGILVVNPGSLARPRQYPREKTYAILTIAEGGPPQAEIRVL